MAMKKPRPTDGGGNWMDTYGDMVTLLMTFFVGMEKHIGQGASVKGSNQGH